MRVFFDTSVLIAGVKNKIGGSGFLLLLTEKGRIRAILSSLIIEETRRNLGTKLGQKATLEFVAWFAKTKPIIVQVSKAEIERYHKFVATKDAHVLAAAAKSKAQVLVTLDQKHLLSLRDKASFPFRILLPLELIWELK